MEVYTDGSCIGRHQNKRYAGAGVWFGKEDCRNTSIPIPSTYSTNQYAELLAIKYALVYCRRVTSLIIKTDSVYSIKCLTTWHNKWTENGWKNSKGKDVTNSQVIKQCLELINQRKNNKYSTSLVHVKGHSESEGNNGADELANIGSKLSRDKDL